MTSMIGATGYQASPMSTGGNKIPKGYSVGRLQQFTPEQMQLFQSLFSQISPDSFTSRLAQGDESIFDQVEAPALRQFSGLQGNIASRFSGMGSGARRSSGFQNEMSSASQEFAEKLQSNRVDLQRQAIRDLMGMSNELLAQRPYEQILAKKSMPFWKQLLLGGLDEAADFGRSYGKAAMLGGV